MPASIRVAGSGAAAVTAGLVVTWIVSTRKSQPLVAAFGVVIVTEVIGRAWELLSEKFAKSLELLAAGIPEKVWLATCVAPENAVTV